MIYGLSGDQGAGKSTLAGALVHYCQQRGRRAKVLSFATPLKRLCADLFGFPPGWEAWDQQQKNAPSPYAGWTYRRIYQHVGAQMRAVWPDVWVAAAMREATRLQTVEGYCDIVFDDMRYENEADAIANVGGVCIRLTDAPLGLGDHISDRALDGYEFDTALATREIGLQRAVEVLACYLEVL